MQPSHPLSPPSLPVLNLSQHQSLFQWVSFSHQVTKCWSFNFSIWPSYQYSGPISFRIYWFDFLAVQGTLKSLLQHHNLKASVLWCSVFFTVHFSHPYITTGKTRALTRWTFVGKVMSLLFNMLCRLVIAFLPRNKSLWISWLQSPSTVILEPKKRKSVAVWFPHLFAMKWWDWIPWSLLFECWVLSQLFHSLLSPSPKGCLVPLHFLLLRWCPLNIWGWWYFSWKSWF